MMGSLMNFKRFAGRWIVRHTGILLLMVGTALSLVLGYAGFSKLPSVEGGTPTTWDRLYLTFQLFIGESGYVAMPVSWELEVARVLAPLVSAYAAVSALVLVFHERFRLFWARLTYQNHVVICGLGDIGFLLTQRLREAGRRVMVIEPEVKNDHIVAAKEQGAVVILGDPTDSAVLCGARVGRADTVIAVCETDGLNSDIADLVGRLVKRNRIVKCYAHITNRYLCHFLMGQAITAQTNDAYQLEFFNIYDSAARLLLSQNAFGREAPKDGSPHLCLIGLGPLGESLVVRAERIWRSTVQAGKKLRLTLLDAQAADQVKMLKLEYPFLAETCQIDAFDLDTHFPGFLQGWSSFVLSELDEFDKFYICLNDDTSALTAAFMLQQRTRAFRIPIAVAVNHYDGLARSLGWRREKDESSSLPDKTSLRIFSILDQTCRMDMLNEGIYEDLAIAIHQAFCKAEVARGRVAQDPALAPWYPQEGKMGLAENYKEDNRRQARSIGRRLWGQGYGIEPVNCVDNACFAFDEEHVVKLPGIAQAETELETLARLEHQAWMEDRLQQGWQPGVQRDNAHKIHNLLYDWYDPRLKESARQQTRQIIRDWSPLLAQVDLQIYRRRQWE
jgi:voltage-gated potassium channel Kch